MSWRELLAVVAIVVLAAVLAVGMTAIARANF